MGYAAGTIRRGPAAESASLDRSAFSVAVTLSQCPPCSFVRPATRRRHLQAIALQAVYQRSPRLGSGLRLAVARSRLDSRAAPSRYRNDRQRVRQPIAQQVDAIAHSHPCSRFGAFSVDLHVPSLRSRGSQRPRLEKPREPEPLIDPHPLLLTTHLSFGTACIGILCGLSTDRTIPVTSTLLQSLATQTEELKDQGLFKTERLIAGPQQAAIEVNSNGDAREVINLCANNYLGLANHPAIIAAAHRALDDFGFGMASVRFICGTQTIHKALEARISEFLKTEDTILYPSCFDANGGLFETILGKEDAVISDALNHASIIDGIRLSKAQRFRYRNNDMDDLETQLKAAAGCTHKLIVTDGVFSMDGTIASLEAICDLADRYGALTMIDDCHATGFLGSTGRGTHEYRDVMGRIDIITGTLGKALGGASGGFTSGRREIIAWLRQRSRPYLFSNSVAPPIAATSIAVLELLENDPSLRTKVHENASYFRARMGELGFDLVPGEHPIIPVMLGDARLATQMADRLLEHGIYVIGFSFPVVPQGQARIRTQMSAGLTKEHLDRAIEAFATVGRELGVISA